MVLAEQAFDDVAPCSKSARKVALRIFDFVPQNHHNPYVVEDLDCHSEEVTVKLKLVLFGNGLHLNGQPEDGGFFFG